jgi:hypothetical protein
VIDQGGHESTLDVMTFTDTVCLSDEDEGVCLDDFEFYAIDEQTGLSHHQDGIVGMAPIQTDRKSTEGPSFV